MRRCDFCQQPITGDACGLCRREAVQLAADRDREWWSA